VTSFTPAKGLDALIAAKILRPQVNAVAARLLDAAQRAAPPAKVWVTLEDDRVRHTHREADGQEVPDNIPFILARPADAKQHGHEGHEMAMMPRDESLSPANRYNCRCVAVMLPEAIAKTMRLEHATVIGTRSTAEVSTDFQRVAESEHAEYGGGWFARAAREAAAGDVSP
jgi:uncharacterized protein with gpF-like domain